VTSAIIYLESRVILVKIARWLPRLRNVQRIARSSLR